MRFLFEPPPAELAGFRAFDRDHPEVYAMFRRFAFEVHRAGHSRFSARAIVHRIRWETAMKPTDEQFKINNNWTPYLARKLAAENTMFADFFEFRHAKADEE